MTGARERRIALSGWLDKQGGVHGDGMPANAYWVNCECEEWIGVRLEFPLECRSASDCECIKQGIPNVERELEHIFLALHQQVSDK